MSSEALHNVESSESLLPYVTAVTTQTELNNDEHPPETVQIQEKYEEILTSPETELFYLHAATSTADLLNTQSLPESDTLLSINKSEGIMR